MFNKPVKHKHESIFALANENKHQVVPGKGLFGNPVQYGGSAKGLMQGNKQARAELMRK